MPQAPNTIALAPGTRVLVTAGASGIGRAIADLLLAHGARAHICDVSDDFLADFAKAWPDAGRSKADVSSEADVARMFADVRAKLGGLDVLVNNAGIAGPTGGVEDISPADWRRTHRRLPDRPVPVRPSRGSDAEGRGRRLDRQSVVGGWALRLCVRTPYSAAKWGVIGFTQSLAKELGPANIRVNAILPGIVEGPRMSGVIAARAKQVGVSYAEMEKTYLDRVSLRRMVSAEDVAATVLFLVSEAGRNMSGQSIGVDGNVESL